MAQYVTLVHPKLPGREITKQERAVPHYERAGWRRKNKHSGPSARSAQPATQEKPAEQKASE